MSVIAAAHYRETEDALAKDTIIIQMAAEIPATLDCGGWNFMQIALDEYHNRGGKIPTHIGGPANAIKRLKNV